MVDVYRRIRSWSDDDLRKAVKNSRSYRSVLIQLGLVPAGGNYDHVRRIITNLSLDTSHFTGKGWNRGLIFVPRPRLSLEELLVDGRPTQSHKLRKRLINEGLKKEECEICGWSERSVDGRIPLELDHINGVKVDNRLSNLRVLCPNCHSLQVTHRGRNRKSVRG